eukprot:5525147-Alexandrium_andersonii.AAC.1
MSSSVSARTTAGAAPAVRPRASSTVFTSPVQSSLRSVQGSGAEACLPGFALTAGAGEAPAL